MGPGWNEAEAIASTRPNRSGTYPLDGRRIDLALFAIAVDDGTGNILDDRADSSTNRAPAETIDQGVFEHFQRPPTLCGIRQGRIVIFAAGVGYRK